jgi:FkbM family methyltransferase
MLIFDIGANVGAWTRANLQSARQIISVEASPQTYERLKASVTADKVIALNYAVCNNDNKDVTFYHANCDVLSTMNKDWLTSPSSRFYNQQYREIRVKSITLDKLIEQYGVPDLLKIDVEGGEFEVVSSLHTKVPLLCFEWASEVNDITFRCLDYLSSMGYTKFHIQLTDNYTFRPRDDDYTSVESVKEELGKFLPKEQWGMIWAV